MLPAVFVRLDALPLTPNGKVDRAALPAPDSANTLQDEAPTGPRTDTEQRVAEILGELLDLEEIGLDDNFFLLGGHSLLGAQLIARLRDAFGVDIGLAQPLSRPRPWLRCRPKWIALAAKTALRRNMFSEHLTKEDERPLIASNNDPTRDECAPGQHHRPSQE